MTKTTITLIDVRTALDARQLDVVNPANVTQLELQARMLAGVLTGREKPLKQDKERVSKFLVAIWGERAARLDDAVASGIAHDDSGEALDDPRTESDAAQAALADDSEEADDEAPADARSGDEAEEASDEPSEDEEEQGEKSVVKGKYRQEYKARGNARGCGDWMHRMLAGLTLGAKKKLDIRKLTAICEANNLGAELAKYTTAEKQMRNGWEGRARMSIGLALRIRAAEQNALIVPTDLYNEGVQRLDATNKRANAEGGNRAHFVDWSSEQEDDLVFLTPVGADADCFKAILAKKEANSKTLAEGRKKAKSGEPARASEEGALEA